MYSFLSLIGVKKLLGVNEDNPIEMESRYDSVTKRLMILSKIPDNGRICVNDNGTIALENESNFTWLKRTITGDDRLRSVKAIKNIINITEEFIFDTVNNKYLTSKKENKELDHEKLEYNRKITQLICINNELIKTKNGITRLRNTTYKDDIPICSDIQIIENKITSLVELIQTKLNELDISIEQQV